MRTYQQAADRVHHIIDQLSEGDKQHIEQVFDVILWALYGQDVLSQSGKGVYGWNFRQSNGRMTLVIKAIESGVPLVAFVTAITPIGCIEQMFDLVEKEKLRWQRDRYPAI
jgi:hypothetical protein